MPQDTLKDFTQLHAYEAFFHSCCNERQRDAEALARALSGHLGGSWLDYGSGDGRLLEHILDLSKPAAHLRLTLFDPDERYTRDAKSRLARYGAQTKADWGDAKYDVVLANHVLYYVPDLSDWLAKAQAALNPSGVLAVLMGSSNTPFGALWAQLFAAAGEATPYASADDVKAQLGAVRYTEIEVPFDVNFADSMENRRSLLRFLLGDHYTRLSSKTELERSLDPFAVGNRIKANHVDSLILVNKDA